MLLIKVACNSAIYIRYEAQKDSLARKNKRTSLVN